MALLGVALAGAYGVVSMAMQARKFAHGYYQATLIANNQLEHAKNLPFTELYLLEEDNQTRVNDLGETDSDGLYVRSTQVEQDWDGNTNLAAVIVSVAVPHPRHPGTVAGTSTVSTLLRRMD